MALTAIEILRLHLGGSVDKYDFSSFSLELNIGHIGRFIGIVLEILRMIPINITINNAYITTFIMRTNGSGFTIAIG